MEFNSELYFITDKIIIVSGRTISKLEKAVEQLKEGGRNGNKGLFSIEVLRTLFYICR